MSPELQLMQRAALAGGQVLMKHWKQVVGREKGPRDLVSEADLASQRVIREVLASELPDYDFLGEEDDPTIALARRSEYRWIVDPLDGTTNYLHGYPAFAVVIALQKGKEIVAGVVYDPVMKEMFAAAAGHGATLNGEPIATSACQTASAALVAASFSALVTRDSPEVERFVEALMHCQAVRRLGSAALNLCYVAAGRMDAYWATSVKIWDIAAGVLIVREAGGIVTHVTGRPLDLAVPELLAASTESLSLDLRSILNRAAT